MDIFDIFNLTTEAAEVPVETEAVEAAEEEEEENEGASEEDGILSLLPEKSEQKKPEPRKSEPKKPEVTPEEMAVLKQDREALLKKCKDFLLTWLSDGERKRYKDAENDISAILTAGDAAPYAVHKRIQEEYTPGMQLIAGICCTLTAEAAENLLLQSHLKSMRALNGCLAAKAKAKAKAKTERYGMKDTNGIAIDHNDVFNWAMEYLLVDEVKAEAERKAAAEKKKKAKKTKDANSKKKATEVSFDELFGMTAE